MSLSSPTLTSAIGHSAEHSSHTVTVSPNSFSSLALPSPTSPSTTPTTSPTITSHTANNLLAAAAARVESRPVTYGPLWAVRCATKAKPRMELQVYDVFCMVFLDRPGAYYRVDQLARTARGLITSDFIVSQLRTYHRLVCPPQRPRPDGEELFLTNTELKEWWLMPAKARASFDTLCTASSPPAAYDFSYLPFLRHFIPQSCSKDADAEYRFFNSLARYVPLLLSADVELRRSPALATSAYAYGVFARRQLKDGDYRRPVQAVRGEVVLISEREHEALVRDRADFSVLELDGEGLNRLLAPGQTGRKRRRVTKRGKAGVVAGGVAFINHACAQHANMWPAVWEREEDTGSAQWQVVTPKWDVKKGAELFLFYAGFDEAEARANWPCSVCASVQ